MNCVLLFAKMEEKVLEKSKNFVSPEKWEPCPEKVFWAARAIDGVSVKRV